MANLVEADNFDAGVYQLETTDPVMGGPGGVSNSQAQALANRTKYLKGKLDSLVITPTTPPQFDNDTSLATTEFVKRQGLQSADVRVLTGATALTAADAGKTIIGGSAADFAVTLPAANAFPAGGRLEVFNVNGGKMTLQRAGADIINTGGQSRLADVLGVGDSMVLVSNGVSQWYAVAGTIPLRDTAAFGFSLNANGYQKLPSGLLLQWGRFVTAAATSQSITLPITFPTAKLQHLVSRSNGSSFPGIAVEPSHIFTDLGSIPLTLSVAQSGIGITFIAIGY
jgi:hypothetical protein